VTKRKNYFNHLLVSKALILAFIIKSIFTNRGYLWC